MSNSSYYEVSGGGYSSSTTDTPLSQLRLTVYATNVHRAADGAVWIRDVYDIIRIDPVGGTYRRVAGISPDTITNGPYPSVRDGIGGPATDVLMNWEANSQITTDATGHLLMVDQHAIYRVGDTGLVELVAGTGLVGATTDGEPAATADIDPHQVLVDATGVIWFLTDFGQSSAGRGYNGFTRLNRIGIDGTLHKVAGTGDPTPAGDGGAASAASFAATDLALDPAGNVVLVGPSDTDAAGFYDGRVVVRVVNTTTGTMTSVLPTGRGCQHPVQNYRDGGRMQVRSGVLQYTGYRYGALDVDTSETRQCQLDLTTGATSDTSMGIAGFDVRSNIDLAPDGTAWFTAYSDTPGEGGLYSVGTVAPLATDTIVWERPVFAGLVTAAPGGAPAQPIIAGSAGDPSWSPGHTRVVYTAESAGQFDLWVANADGSSPQQITNDSSREDGAVWSPDGTRIAFSRETASVFDIWTSRPDGSDQRRVTSGIGADRAPTWSPNSRQIAYASNQNLWISDAGGANPRQLTAGPDLEADPDWSPDGARIAFTFKALGGNAELHVVNVDGTNHRVLLDAEPAYTTSPSWSPDGTHVAFSSNATGTNRIWTMKADGSELAQLSTLGGLRPDWGVSPVASPPPARLDVTATTATTPVVAGTSFTVTGKASNLGTGPAAQSSIDFTVTNASIATLTMSGAICQVVSATSRRCTLGTLAAPQRRSYSLGLIGGTPGVATATAHLTCACTDPGATATAPRTIAATPPKPTLRVGVNGPTAADQGDPLTYTYVVTNDLAVNAAAAKLTVVPTTKPKVWPVPVASLTSTAGTCTTAPLVCSLGSLTPGESATITLATTGGVHGGSLTMTGKATCTCTDPVATDNTAAITTLVKPRVDISIGITNPTHVTGDEPIVFTGTINGLGDNTVDVDADFTVPDGVDPTFVRPSTGGTCHTVGQVVHCSWVGVGGVPSVSIGGNADLGGNYHLMGDLGNCSCIDTNTSNNHFVGPDCEHPQVANLVIRKLSPDRAEIGDIITWTIEVENRGPQGAPGVIVRDALPAAVQYVGTTPDQGSCVYATTGRLVTCNLGTVANGDTVRVLVRARALKPGTITNGADLTCTCHNRSGSGGGGTSTQAPGIPTWPVVPAPNVEWCTDFRIPGICNLVVRLPNPNPSTIPGGWLEIPRGPGNGGGGLRLAPGPYTTGVNCVELPLVIRCTFPPTPPGGRPYPIPVYPDDRGNYNHDFTWNCGCTDRGPTIIDVGPHTPHCDCVGGQILFDSDVTGDRDVYSTTLTGQITNLTDNAATEDAGAVWSPDRKQFAFHRGLPGKRKLWIATLDNAGCIKSQLYIPDQPNSDNYQPDWSPDGGTLAFISKQSGNHDIWTIGIDGHGLTRVTSASVDDRAPSFSNDGDRIAFASRRTPTTSGGDWNIWTAKADGSGGERFLSTAAPGYATTGADYSPAFTRDTFSSVILFHTNSGGNWDLWMMNPDGTNKHRVPNATALDEKNGDWAISDTKIVYDAGTGSAGIWLMNGDGTNRHQIAATGGKDQAPSW